MPTFTQTAFVRVEDPGQRKELCQWLEGIGYKRGLVSCLTPNYNNDDEEVVSCQINGQYSLIADRHANMLLNMDIGFIDCGANIEMFKALAALRDDTIENQWFVWDEPTDGDDKWRLRKEDTWQCWWDFETHKASPVEIVEHFKQKE